MYFSATTYDWSNLTITTYMSPSGLELIPSASHSDRRGDRLGADGAGTNSGAESPL